MFSFAKIMAVLAVSLSVATAAPAEDARAKALASLMANGKEGSVLADGVEVTYIATSDKLNTTDLEKRANPGVFFTNDINFLGAQIYFPAVPLNLCINMPSNWQNVVSSFGPDVGLVCFGFHFLNCASDIGSFGPVSSPGVSTIARWELNGVNWNDKVNSYRCSLR
ncbi:hypothetical protein EXIGLDRAFT_692303 [Exidia glandulosa HHB12029]|uniref:Uncharacterized protein n=1 Tax=Exidia glandulosa HHB12029 TaxID=1314781 RepID=A0A165P1L3_EXIGL|nr:hypothetical protein EXIGLDRAFT_692303 [Exidia glandulosa HHB12029]